MATVNFINRKKSQSRGGLRAVLKYTMQYEKTEFEGVSLVSGMNCTPQTVYEEFINTKLLHGKDVGRMYYHFVQSFPKNENVSPTTVHEVALKLAEFYSDFEVLVATHTDRDHLHSHFIINSVNYETGKKLHQSAYAIQELRQKSDELCVQYGLSICKPKQDRVKAMSIGEYHMAVKGESWKLQLANIIDECMKYSDSRKTFVSLMECEGIKVRWTDSRKNITYELPSGKRCRDNKLHEEKYFKERMEKEFAIRREIIYGRTQAEEQTSADAEPTYSTELKHGNTAMPGNNSRAVAVSERGATQHFTDGTVDTRQAERDAQLLYSERADEKIRYDDSGVAELEQDALTGWETEREVFLTAQIKIAEHRAGTDTGICGIGLVNFGSNILRLGNAVERMAAPTRAVDSTGQIVAVERKKGIGQKKDDHESQEYKFIQMMY